MMNKEIQLIIEMIAGDKQSYTSNELASFLNLKYTNGVYPYLKKLSDKELIHKIFKGDYSLNIHHNKIKDIKFVVTIFGKPAGILFTNESKKILQKFCKNPIIPKNQITRENLTTIKKIAEKTKVIHAVKEKGKEEDYFIACWEEPAKRVLDFFDIKLDFDEEEFKHTVIKYYSSIKNTSSPFDDETQKQLKRLNMETYLGNRDFILNKIKQYEFSFLDNVRNLTNSKNKQFTNPFCITSKITDWKMKYIYNTDKIEGNPLSMQDVRTILTVGSLSVEQDSKAVLETVNSRTALDNIFETSNELNIDFIKKLHLATQQGIDELAGGYKDKENCITDNEGTLIDTTTPVEFVEKRMDELLSWYDKNKSKLHPFVLAIIFHNQFVYIHPFNDGNGRVARLLLNFILIKNAYFPIIFYNDEKSKYYTYIRSSKTGDIKDFVSYILNLYRVQLEEF
ncbi:MAG: Fic family protein [Candidatus Nanoarchaeia archaeon]|nr:Fic family protein [Candidatus Nanoarchaeia archaeon]